jgi:hypothetical protein
LRRDFTSTEESSSRKPSLTSAEPEDACFCQRSVAGSEGRRAAARGGRRESVTRITIGFIQFRTGSTV